MVFSSTVFLFIFFPTTLLGFFLLPNKVKNTYLLLISLAFYAWGEPVYIVLMLFSIVLNYLLGLWIDNCKKKRTATLLLTVGVLVNLSLLGYFKYFNFIIENVNRLTNQNMVVPDIILPIGISFYTFQTMSYVIDVYRQKVNANLPHGGGGGREIY